MNTYPKEKSRFGDNFIKPQYDSNCFSCIPNTILKILGKVEIANKLNERFLPSGSINSAKVVFIFVDAFGWTFFEKYKDKYPSLRRFMEKGMISRITSQFPSTTAAHVTSINTGLPVGESGVYEWFYYEPKLDAVIAPLLFSFARDKERGTLESINANPAELFPKKTIYKSLKKVGVESNVFLPSEFIKSPYNNIVSAGANLYPYISPAEGLTAMAEMLKNTSKKSYYFFYYGKIDSIGHEYGTGTSYFDSEVDLFFNSLENAFFKLLEEKDNKTLVLLSADHGQTNINPKTTIYINKKIKNIEKYLKTNKTRDIIAPEGSCRDMFLHVKEELLAEFTDKLKILLKGKAEIYSTQLLIEKGFFGEKISKKFLSRVGNLVILPYKGESVWWYEKGVFEQKHIGHHGGLTDEEMEIPFLALKI